MSGDNNFNYWDKSDPDEESIYDFDVEIQKKYQNLDELYQKIVPKERLTQALKSSLKERKELEIKEDDCYVYGEITFRTLSYIFEVIRLKFGNNILPGNFYDLGSVFF